MIVTENITFGENKFKHTFSDDGFLIQKVGTNEVYSEATDVLNSDFSYVETNCTDDFRESSVKL